MKGTFGITVDHLQKLGACLEGQRAFKRAFPDGGGYQEVLDRFAEEGRIDFARWLFSKIGPTEDVRIFENEILDEKKELFFAGSMDFKRSVFVRSIFVGASLYAGEGIQAGKGIRAGLGIRAGASIRSPEELEAQVMPWANKIENCTVTYYDCCVKCCGKTDGITYSGARAVPYETCAVDPDVIPLGSVVFVDYENGELHQYRAEDVGGGIKGNHIDICVASHEEALSLGRRTATVYWMEAEEFG